MTTPMTASQRADLIGDAMRLFNGGDAAGRTPEWNRLNWLIDAVEQAHGITALPPVELMPCRFCGFEKPEPPEYGASRIKCGNCGLEVWASDRRADKLVELWNRRADPLRNR